MDLTGKILGQYKLVELLGEGGLATVYKGYQQNLNRWVAVKVLHSDEQQVLARFEREAKAVALLRHRNILMVYEYGFADSRPFIAMEYVEQGTLENYLTGHPLEWSHAVHIAISVGEALHYAHGHGLIHRDVKPSNILMPQKDWPLLADFGMVKVSDDDRVLTATGMIMGTPAYIAPEQARGEKIGIHADMYALGVILFEMVTGRLPFDYDNANMLMLAHIQETPPSPREFNPACPPELEQIIIKTLEKSSTDRYPDMAAMVTALKGVLATHQLDVNNMGTREFGDVSPDEASFRPSTGPHPQETNSTVRLMIPDKNVSIALPEWELKTEYLTIGRTHGKNHVDIDLGPHGAVESGISRQHSRLTKQGNTWLIDDLGSTNGTLVNQVKLTPGVPVSLKNGDVIHLGRMHLIFLTSAKESEG